MHEGPITDEAQPQFSVIVPTFDDWPSLADCLRSLDEQTIGSDFEVIVVDDGSRNSAPGSIADSEKAYPLSIIRQPHAGIAAARNRGVQNSRGMVLVFTDADCRLQPDCLSALAAAITATPQHNCFQLHLVGDCSNSLGRAEELRLIAIQNQMLQPSGCIRYLNTAGFAIRRSHKRIESGPFNSGVSRGEDTLLLANLIEHGELPFFVPGATVCHEISMSLTECLRKDVQSAWLEGRTFKIIAAKGIRLRMDNKQRLGMLLSTWRISSQPTIGRPAWFVLVTRQFFERTVSMLYKYLVP